LIGGGPVPLTGEVSLAHHGVPRIGLTDSRASRVMMHPCRALPS
jgi:hypothetical protein